MDGTYTLDKTIAKMRGRGKSDRELDDALDLSREIQKTIAEKGLRPMIRTFYNRTAFQLPGDAAVRISLDTELTMIREDNYEHPRSGTHWRRMDVGTIAPFDHLPEEDIHGFPYAVLEVKLQTSVGAVAPEWVRALVESHVVEEVPKFSKFIHGVAMLLESRVTLLPFWLPQMGREIRKAVPETGSLLKRKSTYGSIVTNGTGSSGVAVIDRKGKGVMKDEIQVEIDEDEDDEKTPLLVKPKEEKQISWFRNPMGKSKQAYGQAPGIMSSMNGKRIVLPVRVEPKVFFANERTFLSWLHFCIVLGGLALGLLNFGDTVGQISGGLFTGVAMMFMVYALGLYQWRAEMIRRRGRDFY